MTLMTTDVDRVSDFAWHIFSLVDAPIEIVIGTWFLYNLLGMLIRFPRTSALPNSFLQGVSCFFGLAVTCLFLPMNHYAGKVVVGESTELAFPSYQPPDIPQVHKRT